jgi:hypothetical protein
LNKASSMTLCFTIFRSNWIDQFYLEGTAAISAPGCCSCSTSAGDC